MSESDSWAVSTLPSTTEPPSPTPEQGTLGEPSLPQSDAPRGAAGQGLFHRSLPECLVFASGWAGVLALALAALLPWYRVPTDAPLGAPITGIEPGVTWLFRGLCACVVALQLVPARRRRLARQAAFPLLAAVLLYPTAILHTAPQLAARGAWLWAQHDELTGYDGDIYTSQEVRDVEWHQRTLAVDEPITNRVAKAPAWSPANLEWGRLIEITEWFGLGSWFGQCLARGWVFAVAGTVLLLLARLAHSLRRSEGDEAATTAPCVVCGAFAAGVFAIAVGSYFVCAHHLAAACDLARSGDPEVALGALSRAAAALPALGEDGAYVSQVGRLEAELRRATPAAAFHRAQRLAEDGFAQQARDAMLAELSVAPPGSALQRELVKGLLSRAIAEMNSGQLNPAIVLLETILAADPANLKANYVLQLACVRAGRLDELRLLTVRMRETYRFLNTPTKRSVLAAAQEHLAVAELASGGPAQALAHWRHAKRPPK
jgi:hypothetical protein